MMHYLRTVCFSYGGVKTQTCAHSKLKLVNLTEFKVVFFWFFVVCLFFLTALIELLKSVLGVLFFFLLFYLFLREGDRI